MSEAAPALAPAATSRWFAVWTRSRHERAVFEQLDERGIEAFLPTTPRWSRWKDRTKKIDFPLFPGYCFARFAPAQPPAGPEVRRRRIDRVVQRRAGAHTRRGVEGIRHALNSALPCDPCPMLKTGMKVEVVHGPLKGVAGRLQRKGAQARLVLSVDLIGRGVSVQVDAADVRPLKARTDCVPMKIGNVSLASHYAIAPMAGMTDTAFRRLVKRQGGCGLVVTEMVSRRVSCAASTARSSTPSTRKRSGRSRFRSSAGIPGRWPRPRRIVQDLGADIVDVNMGCPVPKIAKHNAGCSLMREPEHAAVGDRGDGQGGDDPGDREDAGRMGRRPSINAADAGEDGGGRRGGRGRRSRPDRGAVVQRISDWNLISEVASGCRHPRVRQRRLRRAGADHRAARTTRVSGVLVGRGVLRNPWILAQAHDIAEGRPARPVSLAERGQFLLDYMDLLLYGARGRSRGLPPYGHPRCGRG